jgi:hypothetical protein
VSFKGKCFDVPLLITRYRLARMENRVADLPHIDLLHPTRTAFGKNWPDCRLQTAEQYLFRFYRDDDLPGYLIPQVWAGYVRYGETRGVQGIVEHNRLDLLSLIALATVLARVYAEPGHRYADPLSIARAHRRSGSESVALLHLQEQMYALSEQALLELAWLYARSSRWEEAVVIWERLAAQGVLQAIERLAKYFEHTKRNYQAALTYSEALISHENEVAGEYYWDGGYMGNPVLAPLRDFCQDILIVEVNALRRDQLPRQAAEIFNRLNEITFNSALVHEIDLINTMNKLFENGNLVNTRYKPIRFHAIGAEEELSALDISSKVDCSWEFLRELHALGR